jgi:hypothetical protein
MARKKNSALVNNREEKARTEVRHALRDLPTTSADAIKKEREFLSFAAARFPEDIDFGRLLDRLVDIRNGLLDRLFDVHKSDAFRLSDVHKSDAFRDHDYIFRAICANRIERALPPSPWRDYALQVLRRPDPPSRDALLRNGMSERNHTICFAVLTAVRLGLAPTRNPAARYSGGAHSACSLVAEELKKMGVRRCNEDAVQKIYKKSEKELPDLLADLLALLESPSKNFPSEK